MTDEMAVHCVDDVCLTLIETCFRLTSSNSRKLSGLCISQKQQIVDFETFKNYY